MGPAWLWFVIAVVAVVAGVALLAVDKSRESSRHRERRRWADLHSWHFSDEDPRMVSHWTEGAMGYYQADAAANVVAGTTFTGEGKRTLYVFDIESERRVPATVVALRCGISFPVLELWLASVPFQRDEMPELLGPAGKRYAFANDAAARGLLSDHLVEAANQLGGDVSVVWLEQDWALAAVSADAGPARLERLMRGLGSLADIVDPVDVDPVPHGPPSDVRYVDHRHEQPHGSIGL